MKRTSLLLMAHFIVAYTYSQQWEQIANTNAFGDGGPRNFIPFNNHLCFISNYNDNETWLYKTDGTVNGTDVVPWVGSHMPNYLSELSVVNSKLVYSATSDGDNELWMWDGGNQGSIKLVDINTSGSSEPHNLVVYNNMILFSANDGTNGFELWKTDGTAQGTEMVKNINQSGSGAPTYFTEYNGNLYFTADDGMNGRELWVTNGTENGTHIVKNICPSGSGHPKNLLSFNGRLYFAASNVSDTVNNKTNVELWATDGSESGTVMVKEICADTLIGSAPSSLTSFQGDLYFTAFNGQSFGLWKSNGTESGTQLVKNYGTLTDAAAPMQEYNGKLYFSTFIDTAQISGQWWSSDGTAVGTSLVKAFESSSFPSLQKIFNGRLILVAAGKLWSSDGTVGGTLPIAPGNSTNQYPGNATNQFLEWMGSLYFAASFTNDGAELWKLTLPTGLDENNQKMNVSIYPNPTTEKIKIIGVKEFMGVNVYSITGEFLRSIEGKSKDIDVKDLPAGIYVIEIIELNSSSRVRFIIE